MEIRPKPFECPDAKCHMSFANADHLEVHVKKHELSLSLTPSTPFKNYIVDQTPTPTRFLNSLEPELFQELPHDNPFDATFRKANSSNAAGCNFLMSESSSLIANLPDSEVLNTPSITIPETPIFLKSIFSKKLGKETSTISVATESTDSLPFTPTRTVQVDADSLQESLNDTRAELSLDDTCHVASDVIDNSRKENKNGAKSYVAQTPVIMSVGNSSVLRPVNTGVPTAVVVTRPTTTVPPAQIMTVNDTSENLKSVEPTQAVVQSVCVTPMLQVMLRLPDGQTMPVQLPVLTSAPVTAAATQPVIHPAVEAPIPIASTPASSTKMKLKEVLTLNAKSGAKGTAASTSVKCVRPNLIRFLPDPTMSDVSPPLSPLMPSQNGRKRRDSVDNPDEKRKKSLERNRAAATRCRVKRKMWINSLERKAEELSRTNAQLQMDVSNLRNEVAHLKTMLLAHKDCPVTQQQRDNTFENEQETYTTVHIVRQNPDDSQCVPNVSSSSNEFMEVELGSVRSMTDGSFASDNSDSSFKER